MMASTNTELLVEHKGTEYEDLKAETGTDTYSYFTVFSNLLEMGIAIIHFGGNHEIHQ